MREISLNSVQLATAVIVLSIGTSRGIDTSQWVAVNAEDCGKVLAIQANARCRSQCNDYGKVNPEECILSATSQNEATGCAIPWAYGPRLKLSEQSAWDLAQCQEFCLDEELCSAFEFRASSKTCTLRSRYQMYQLIYAHDGGGDCGEKYGEFACNDLFQNRCPARCFGRRVCMRRDPDVFSAPRLCIYGKLTEESRCWTPGYAWPLAYYAVPTDFATSATTCALSTEARFDIGTPQRYCHMVIPSARAEQAWLSGLATTGDREPCAYTMTLDPPGMNASDFEGNTALYYCIDDCRKDPNCAWFEWRSEDPSIFTTGSCRFRTAEQVGVARATGGTSFDRSVVSGTPRCIPGTTVTQERVEQAKDLSYDPWPLKEGEVETSFLEECDGLISRVDVAATGAACLEQCLNESRFNATRCVLGAKAYGEASSCVAHLRSIRPETAMPVSSLAECSDLCVAAAACVVWEAWFDAEANQSFCALKTRADVLTDIMTRGEGEQCLGQPSSLTRDESSYRGSVACAQFSSAETSDPGHCQVPFAALGPHRLAIAATLKNHGAECTRAVEKAPKAAVPEGCVVPEDMEFFGPRAAEANNFHFHEAGCLQNWVYGGLDGAAAVGAATAGECQDRCRADEACIYWMWLFDTRECVLRDEAEIRAAVGGDDATYECLLPDGAEKIPGSRCVYSLWRAVGAPLQCLGPRDPLDIDDLLGAAPHKTTTTTTITTEISTASTTTQAYTTATPPSSAPPSLPGVGSDAGKAPDLPIRTAVIAAAAGGAGLLGLAVVAYYMKKRPAPLTPEAYVFGDDDEGERDVVEDDREAVAAVA